jgi:hypothetical protein
LEMTMHDQSNSPTQQAAEQQAPAYTPTTEEVELTCDVEVRTVQIGKLRVKCPCGRVMENTDARAVKRAIDGHWLHAKCDTCGQPFKTMRRLIQQANAMPNRHARRAASAQEGKR